MSWFFLSIITAVSFAIVNLFDKFFLVRYTKTEYGAVKMLGFFSLCIFLFVYLFTDVIDLSSPKIYIPILSGIFEISYIYFYLRAIKGDDVGFAAALFSFTPIFILLISYFLLGAGLKIMPVLGLFIITFGILLLYFSREKSLKNIHHNKTIGVMIITTFISALSSLLLDKSLESFSVLQALILSRGGVFLGSLVILPLIRKQKQAGTSWPFVISEASYLITMYIFIKTLSKGNIVYVSGVVNTQPLFVFAFSWLLSRYLPFILREKFIFQNKILAVISIVVVVVGAFLIKI